VDERLKNSYLFHYAGQTDPSGHATLYDFFGYFAVPINSMGLVCFGNLNFNRHTGELEVTSLTGNRTAGIIKALFNINTQQFGNYSGIFQGLGYALLKAPAVIATPSRKVKADKAALEKNRALLESFLALNNVKYAAASVPESFVEKDRTRWCDYCRKEPDDPKKCSRCGIAQYCNSACQKSHWPHHKRECKAKV